MPAKPADPAYHGLVRSDVFHLIPSGGRLLDLGGGVGATAMALRAQHRFERVGIADMVAPADPAALDFSYQGDLTDPDLLARIGAEQGPFDTILCLDFLEHLPDPWAMVANLHAMLAPGGAIVVSLPNIRHVSVVLPLVLRGEWRYRDAGILDRTHLRFFGKHEACALMTSSGLMLECVETPVPDALRWRWANRLTLGLFANFLNIQTLVRVRKSAS